MNCDIPYFRAAAILVAVVFSPIAQAATFNSTDNGWYLSNGFHDPSNTNIFAGSYDSHRNFFTFDLSSAAGQTVTSAQLNILSQGVMSAGSQTYEVFDYTGSISSLINGLCGENRSFFKVQIALTKRPSG